MKGVLKISKRNSLMLLFAISMSYVVLSGSRLPETEEKPAEDRFTRIVVAENLDEPMGMAFLPAGKILIIERKGTVKIYDSKKKSVRKIGSIPVTTTILKNGKPAHVEEGLMGVIIHPNFNKNHWIYFYHADPDRPVHLLTRWNLVNEQLIPSSKKLILEVPIRRDAAKCTGGSMAFDKQGNFYLAVGTNTVDTKPETINSPDGNITINTTETESAGNTNDLRGKILRIKLNDDGSYSIPEGNLFPVGVEKTKPEIYVMGSRNPWRISIDSKTGYLYWADPGRDDNDLDPDNSRGNDEFNVARKPGNFGWPFFVANNQAYYNVADSFKKENSPSLSSIQHPTNFSPHNTGLTELPETMPAIIWYKYGQSDLFPVLGNGGRSAVGGPIYRKADFAGASRPFPAYYEGKWFITDFIRGWIMTVTMDENGNVKAIDPFLPNENFSSVLDMNFSPDGDLYVLEYGTKWYSRNVNARLVKIEYVAGNRRPKVNIAADRLCGSVPMKVQLSSAGTLDTDGDPLQYEWIITSQGIKKTFKTPHPQLTLQKPGSYHVTLAVTDSKGARSAASLKLEAGNEPPVVEFNLIGRNQTFFFENDSVDYLVHVADKEDGSLTNGGIKRAQVFASIDYASIPINQLTSSVFNTKFDVFSGISAGKILIQQQDCKSCHMMAEKSVGPSYLKIAAKYKNNPKANDTLAERIIKGGSGNWGTASMSAHPNISKNDAKAIANYIMSLGNSQKPDMIPLKGCYKLKPPADESPYGSFVFSAGYRDRGSSSMRSQRGQILQILRYPVLYPRNAEFQQGTRQVITPSLQFMVERHGGYFGFKAIDLTNISEIRISLFVEQWTGVAGGYAECYLDSLGGPLIGKTKWVQVMEERKRVRETFSLTDKKISGKHDIYFVFKNPDAASHQQLMEVSSVEFAK